MNIRSHLGLKAAAVMLAAGGLGVGLIGSGVRASFTDSASGTANISVGTFGINITASNGVISGDKKSVTLTCPPIQSSAAGTCALTFTVTNVGTIPATVSVASNGGSPAWAGAWSDAMTIPAPQLVAAGGTETFNGGISWTTLSNADLGTSHSVTYTVSANG